MASANNAKKGANVRMKRKERKNIAAGQAHIQSTFNNTVVTITDLQGNAVSWCSSGSLNFRGAAVRALRSQPSLLLRPQPRLQSSMA